MKKKNLVATLVLAVSSLAMLASCGGGGNNESDKASVSEAASYSIKLEADAGVTVDDLPTSAKEGDRVTFNIVLEDGKVIDAVTVNGEAITSSTLRYRFTMPAQDVTVKITVATLSGITIDTSAVRKNYFVGNAFDSEGLVVKAKIGDNETVINSGFTVSTPDLTASGTQTVTVTYSGFTQTFDIKVGEFLGDDIDIDVKDGKPIFMARGSFAGFDTVQQLTEAAAGMVKVDFQHNGNWNRYCQSDQITFYSDADNRFHIEVDVSELPGSGEGTGYIFHFGLPNGNGGTGAAEDTGQAGDMKLDVDSANTGKSVTADGKSYLIASNAGKDGQANFYGCCSLTVFDEHTTSAAISNIVLEKVDDKLNVVLSGNFNNYDPSEDSEHSYFYIDLVELGVYSNIAENIAYAFNVTDNENKAGTFTISFEIGGKLTSGSWYFFHYIFGEDAQTTDTNGHDLIWGKTMVESSLAFGDGQYSVGPISGLSSNTWAEGHAGIYYLGGDYVQLDAASMAKEGNDVYAHLTGDYSGILNNDKEDYYFDMMSFTNDTPTFGEDDYALTLTPESDGATKGTFDIAIKLTGKLSEGNVYYFHFGPLPEGSEYRANVYKNVAEASLEGSDGTYTIANAAGFTDSSETWRNGLTTISFAPKA